MAEYSKPLIDADKIIKEVFETDGVESKTELNNIQIQAVSLGLIYSDVFNVSLMGTHLNSFMVLQKSKDRKSMAEFVDSLRSKKEDFLKNSKFTLMG